MKKQARRKIPSLELATSKKNLQEKPLSKYLNRNGHYTTIDCANKQITFISWRSIESALFVNSKTFQNKLNTRSFHNVILESDYRLDAKKASWNFCHLRSNFYAALQTGLINCSIILSLALSGDEISTGDYDKVYLLFESRTFCFHVKTIMARNQSIYLDQRFPWPAFWQSISRFLNSA